MASNDTVKVTRERVDGKCVFTLDFGNGMQWRRRSSWQLAHLLDAIVRASNSERADEGSPAINETKSFGGGA